MNDESAKAPRVQLVMNICLIVSIAFGSLIIILAANRRWRIKTPSRMATQGWDIDIERLPGPVRGKYPASYFADDLFGSPSGDRAALIYSIAEVRMGWTIGCLALFQNIRNPICILNPDRFRCFAMSDTVTWFNESMLAVKTYATPGDPIKLELPFTIIDLAADRFSFIPIRNSLPYSINLANGCFALKQNTEDPAFPSVDGHKFELSTLIWHSNSLLGDYVNRYFSTDV